MQVQSVVVINVTVIENEVLFIKIVVVITFIDCCTFSLFFDLALFSDLIFPGAHQRHLYACQSAEDCGKDAKKTGIDCALIDENYRVCQCQQGYFFNPIDYTCGKIRLIDFLEALICEGCSSSQSMLSCMFTE